MIYIFFKLTFPKHWSDCAFGKGQGDPEADSAILKYKDSGLVENQIKEKIHLSLKPKTKQNHF